MGWWLVGYALPFAIVLMALAGLLQWRDRKASISASGSVPDVAKIDLIGTQDEKIYLEFSTVARERGQ
jgi:hypothetical protein